MSDALPSDLFDTDVKAVRTHVETRYRKKQGQRAALFGVEHEGNMVTIEETLTYTEERISSSARERKRRKVARHGRKISAVPAVEEEKEPHTPRAPPHTEELLLNRVKTQKTNWRNFRTFVLFSSRSPCDTSQMQANQTVSCMDGAVHKILTMVPKEADFAVAFHTKYMNQGKRENKGKSWEGTIRKTWENKIKGWGEARSGRVGLFHWVETTARTSGKLILYDD